MEMGASPSHQDQLPSEDDRKSTSDSLMCGLRSAVILCVGVASSFSFLLGYDIGIMSGAKRLVSRDMSLTTVQVEVLVGSLNIVSGFGGLISGSLADKIGRRPTAALACLLTVVGSLLMASASSYNSLLAGRIVTGLGVGGCFQAPFTSQ